MKTSVLKKFKKNKVKFFPIVIISTLIFVIAVAIRINIAKTYSIDPQIFTRQNYEAFEDFTKKSGVKRAYDVLKEKYPNNDGVAHNFAHIIGFEALYQKDLEGLEICDTAYNYGCYHGFIEVYLKQKGVEAVKDIEDYCINLGRVHSPSCVHGVGHGEMVIASYNLNEALENCNLLQESNRTYCWDGVFMERATGSMLGDGELIEITSETLMEPCASIAEIYQEQCFRNQVAVWYPFFSDDIGQVASQCALISPRFMRTCFESMGLKNVIAARGNSELIINNCLILNNDALDFCLIGSLKEFLFEGQTPEIARSFCNYVSRKYQRDCFSTYDDHFNQFQQRFEKTS